MSISVLCLSSRFHDSSTPAFWTRRLGPGAFDPRPRRPRRFGPQRFGPHLLLLFHKYMWHAKRSSCHVKIFLHIMNFRISFCLCHVFGTVCNNCKCNNCMQGIRRAYPSPKVTLMWVSSYKVPLLKGIPLVGIFCCRTSSNIQEEDTCPADKCKN